ncbi:MAG: FG-GAP-like repeat-containing protein, partial [Flavobacteriales bacterium]
MTRHILLLLALWIGSCASAQLGIEHRFVYPADAWSMAIADMDTDGDGDAVQVNSDHILVHEQVAPGEYRVTSDLGVPGRVDRVRVVDMDGDGVRDLVLARRDANTIAWVRVLGGGVFGSLEDLAVGISKPFDVQAQDLDGDADFDLVFAHDTANVKVSWAENLGGGSFGNAVLIASTLVNFPNYPETYSYFDIGDMENDGDLDVLIDGLVTAWSVNDGSGNFTTVPVPGGLWGENIQLAQLNGDPYPDLLISQGGVQTLINDGSGGFGAPQSNQLGSATYMEALDVDADGDDDLAFRTGGGTGFPDWLEIAHNDGTGQLDTWSSSLPGFNRQPYAIGDLDGANGLDVFGRANFGLFVVLDGSSSEQRITSVPQPLSVSVFDADGDGDNDVAVSGVTTWGSGPGLGVQPLQLAVHMNQGAGNFGQTPIDAWVNDVPIVRTDPTDIDGDGDDDLVAVSQDPIGGTSKQLIVFDNQNPGLDSVGAIGTWWNQYLPHQTIPLLGDLDSDGDPDVTWLSSHIHSSLNMGGGTFAPEQAFSPDWGWIPQAFALCDMDGDTDPDLIWAQGGSAVDSLFWCANNGMGGFGPSQWIGMSGVNWTQESWWLATAPRTEGLQSVDMDLDGAEDLVCFAGDSLAVMLYNGSMYTNSSAVPCFAGSLQVGDMDGDGYPDVVALRPNGDILAWLNQGNGSLGGEFMLASGSLHTGRSDLALADMDGDNDLDVITCSETGSAAWLPNSFNSNFRALGEVWHDTDADATHDPGEGPLPFILLGCDPPYGYPLTDTTGAYAFALEQGLFTLSIQAPDALWTLTTDSTEYHVNLTLLDPVSTGNDFGYVAAVDTTILETFIDPLFGCGGTSVIFLNVTNQGTTTPDGIVSLTLDSMLSYAYANPAPDSVVGQTIHWGFDALYYYSDFPITLVVNSPDTGFIGTVVTLADTLSVLDSLGNVAFTIPVPWSGMVWCSWDPNYKEVDPAGIDTLGYVDIGTEYLDYTVHFQNTGNAPATDVVIRDLLDTDLQPASLTVLGASHPLTSAGIEPAGFLVFTFDGINLPDSGSDFSGSMGYVKYRIHLDDGLPHLTTIENSAAIYFDTNQPVITDTVLNTLIDCSLFTSTITLLGADLLQASEGESYQWFLNGAPVPGATSQELVVSSSGSYTVEV